MPKDNALNNSFMMIFKNRVWLFGVCALLLGTGERLWAVFADHSLFSIEGVQLLIGISLLIGWLNLKPFSEVNFRKRVNYIQCRQQNKVDAEGA